MATKIESYQSNDGRLFTTELEAVKHECLTTLLTVVPELKDRWGVVQSNSNEIATLLKPLADLIEREYCCKDEPAAPVYLENHPEEDPENHPETTLRASDKPRWAVCAGSSRRSAGCDVCPQSFAPDTMLPFCFVSGEPAVDHG